MAFLYGLIILQRKGDILVRYDIPTFLENEPVPVELVARLKDYTVEGQTVMLRCATNRYEPQIHDYYGTYVETVFKDTVPGEDVTVQLDFCTDEIVRFRCAPGDGVPENDTVMVVGTFDEVVSLVVEEDDAAVFIETDKLRIVILKEPWQMTINNRDGYAIWSTKPIDIDGLRRPEHQWNPSQQRWIFLHRYAYPLGFVNHGKRRHAFLSLDLHYDEHIYGFGESYDNIDKRGKIQRLWVQEGFSNASPATYKRTPFYMSTRGYGMYANTSNAVRCRVGDLEHTALSTIVDDAGFMDCYIIYGPSLKEILPRYTAITGQPAVPPLWTFGLWMARISYSRQAQVEAVAEELRAHEIPCDVIHIDTDWYKNDWECDLEFCDKKFPDPAGMTSKLREMGFRVSLWQWPNMVVTSDMFEEGYEQGYLIKRGNGKPYIYSGFEIDAAAIDYSNPAAVVWVQEKFRKLFDFGIAAIKVDFGEGAPPDAVYETVPGESMHALYPLLYNKAIYEVSEDYFGKGNAVVWSRSAWAGSQRYPVHWSGDGVARYEDLACVVRAALSFGMSGFPFYSHDIGGFSGLSSPKLYVRWAQFGLFSSHSRAHGEPPREPWEYGAEAETIFRQYANLRYRMLPYIYSEAVVCGQTSLPMLRALVLDYQDDPTTYTIDDQYLFGRNLLVAPILDDTDARRVYLPYGRWVDYWTKEVIDGGRWISVEAPLDVMPMYVRAGAMLPYAALVQSTDDLSYDPLRVEIYLPGDSGEYTVYVDRDTSFTLRYTRAEAGLNVSAEGTPGEVTFVVYDESGEQEL